MPNVTPITPPRVPLIDPRTGLIDRAWYLFFLSLNDAANASEDTVDTGLEANSLVSSYEATLQSLEQVVKTQQGSTELIAQLAEIQKQVDGLQVNPQQVVRMLSELGDVWFTNLAPYDTIIYNGTWTNIPFVTRAKGRFVYV